MNKVQRKYTLDQAVEYLKKTREEIIKALPYCAPDFANRDPRHLTQAEVDCIARRNSANNPKT